MNGVWWALLFFALACAANALRKMIEAVDHQGELYRTSPGRPGPRRR